MPSGRALLLWEYLSRGLRLMVLLHLFQNSNLVPGAALLQSS